MAGRMNRNCLSQSLGLS